MTVARSQVPPPATAKTSAGKREARAAKPVDIDAMHKDIAARYPKTLARLAE